MISSIISRVVILVFGTLYPAYASYKGVRTKNTKEYVKWMMYWIVFALFTCVETFTDIFLSWFPFYYEIKIILVIWLLSPATKGSSILYRKFVHPMLSSREQEIDEYISKAKEQSYKQFLDIGQKGVTALMQTAIKGGGGIVNQLKKSYSLSDLSDPADGFDEADDILVTDPRLIRRRKQGRSPHRSSSASSASVYFSEVNVGIGRGAGTEVRSIEDISSGYSSGEGLYAAQQPGKIQARESIASHRANSLTRSRSTRVTRSGVLKKTNITSDDSDDNEVFDTNIIFFNDKARKINTLPETHDSSSSETEFFDTPEMIGFDLHGKILISTDRVEKNNQIVDGSTIIPSKLSVVKDNPIDCDATGANLRIPCALGYDTDSEITACKSDISTPPSSSLRFNLTKLSSALSSLYPLRSSAFSDADKHNVESVNLESNYSNPDRSKNVVNDNVTAQMQSEIPACSAPTKIANVGENDDEIKRLEVVDRGGKYNKKHAPLPPRPPKRDAYNLPIKATLVLQPGVVRSMESLNKEVFLNYSPKMRRRSRNASPASRSSKSSESSSSSSKTENALSKMLRLPKRMAQLNIPGKIKDKRHSWGEFFHGKRLNASGKKMHSRSTSSLDAIAENPATDVSKPIQRTASQVSIRSLTDSPLAHRRTSQVQPYLVLKSQQKRKLYETQV